METEQTVIVFGNVKIADACTAWNVTQTMVAVRDARGIQKKLDILMPIVTVMMDSLGVPIVAIKQAAIVFGNARVAGLYTAWSVTITIMDIALIAMD